eukprot:jgi/Mesen1/1758/ME000014S01168
MRRTMIGTGEEGSADLGGSFGDSIGSFSKLQNITLRNVSISGPLPLSLCNLTSLETLDLGLNALNGTIPDCLDRLANLKYLDLDFNGLTGTIPECVGNLTGLYKLYIGSSRYNGIIPHSLCNLTKLEKLDVSFNHLAGTLPQNFSNPALALYVDRNFFSGSSEVTFANGSSFCPANYASNCFDNSGKCSDVGQRTPTDCSAYCNTTSAVGPCAGHGLCSTTAPHTCTCDAGYSLSYGPGTVSCAPATRPPSLPPPLSPPPIWPPPPSPPPLLSPPPPSPPPLTPDTPPPPAPISGKSKSIFKSKWVAVTAGVLIFLCICACCACLDNAKDKQDEELLADRNVTAVPSHSDKLIEMLSQQSVRAITLEDIKAATDNFSEDKLLGKGGYGSVYRGIVDDKCAWAVKRTTKANKNSLVSFEEEVLLISKVCHPNLVQLLGFYAEEDEQILSTSEDAEATGPLNFTERLDIAVGVARGLNYLHSNSQMLIVHRDIKPANILLDCNMQPKIADFGLSKVLAAGVNGSDAGYAVASKLKGTFGYMDPDIQNNLQISPKVDVFSFGVVLLELLTCKPALIKDPTSGETTTLYEWVAGGA